MNAKATQQGLTTSPCKNTAEKCSLSCAFLAGEWNALAGSHWGTVLHRQEKGNARWWGGCAGTVVGAERLLECFEIPLGSEIWFQNRVVGEFLGSQKFVLCNSSEGDRKEGIWEKEFVPKCKGGEWDMKAPVATISRAQLVVRIPGSYLFQICCGQMLHLMHL